MLRLDRRLGSGRSVHICCTDRHDGDFHVDSNPSALTERRRRVSEHPWTWLRQVHGSTIVEVSAPGQHAGAEADGAITARPDAVLAVQSADCAPVVLLGESMVGVAHAGWRGMVAGVLPAALDRMAERGESGPVRAILGPCIGVPHYEFGPDLLDQLAGALGDEVRSTTAHGEPALDLVAAVRASLGNRVDSLTVLGHDTGDRRWYSHRVRADTGRQATAVWISA